MKVLAENNNNEQMKDGGKNDSEIYDGKINNKEKGLFLIFFMV